MVAYALGSSGQTYLGGPTAWFNGGTTKWETVFLRVAPTVDPGINNVFATGFYNTTTQAKFIFQNSVGDRMRYEYLSDNAQDVVALNIGEMVNWFADHDWLKQGGQVVSLYKEGALVSSDGTATSNFSPSTGIRIGAAPNGGASVPQRCECLAIWTGLHADSVWLTAAEMLQICRGRDPRAVRPQHLAHLYLPVGDGTVFHDLVGGVHAPYASTPGVPVSTTPFLRPVGVHCG